MLFGFERFHTAKGYQRPKRLLWFLTVSLCFLYSTATYAFIAEITLNYNYLRRTFDSLNWFANQAVSAGVSFYVFQSIAFELSYTQGLFIRKEIENALNNSTAQRTSSQKTDSYEVSMIFLFGDRRAAWQPFIRLGAAYIQRQQQVQIDNDIPFSVEPSDAIAPAAGAGFRLVLSEKFNLRVGVDAVQTPIGNHAFVYDLSGRVGFSFVLY
ncbi:MAG: hypothetical protein NZ480_09455 [Bdellovibrionaceae bacterium]|nr:hypothetical protein [Pseudobdellovibrionaceae bacterium]MDW8191021.1 hypothetical protein [Pseudobdellovibrionaceae bacterium]